MTTRVALIGLDQLSAGLYLRHLRRMPGVWLTAAVEAQSCLLAARGEWLQGVATYSSHRDLLNQAAVDGVVICDAGCHRKEIAVDCARAGKSILCENPISESVVEAREMWAISQAHDVLFAVCFPIRLSAVHGRIRQRVLEGNLGDLLKVKVRMSGASSGAEARDSSSGKKIPRMRLDTTLIDTLRWLLAAEFTVVEVTEPGGAPHGRSGCLRLEMSNGVAVIVEGSRMHLPEAVTMPRSYCLEISGSGGHLDLDLISEASSIRSELDRDEPATAPTYRMLGNFVEAMQGRAQIAAAGTDGLRAIEVLEAARRAWEFRSAVAL